MPPIRSAVNMSLALRVRQWLEDILPVYIANEVDVPIQEVSEDWASNEFTRASSLDKCAKRHAAERTGAIEKHKFGKKMLYKFRMANAAAMEAKKAIKWGIENKAPGSWRFNSEFRMWSQGEDTYNLAGTPDVFLVVDKGSGRDTLSMPVEIKKTYAWEGIAPSFVWQTIAYMDLAESNGHECPYGYVYTLYSDDFKESAEEDANTLTHKVWLVARVEGGWQVMDGYNPIVFKSTYFPVNEAGENFFSDESLREMLDDHELWYDRFEFNQEGATVTDPDVETPFQWLCGTFEKPDTYLRAYGGYKAGDRKPGTGQITHACPLFLKCWGHLLPERFQKSGIPDILYINGTKDDPDSWTFAASE